MERNKHSWNLISDWERVESKSGKFKEEVCITCGCKRQSWKFDYINKQTNFYLYLPVNSRSKKFVTTHIPCNNDKEKLINNIGDPIGKIVKLAEEDKTLKVTYKPIEKKKKIIYSFQREDEKGELKLKAILTDCFVIIKLLMESIKENGLPEDKAFEMASRMIESQGYKSWLDKLNKKK